MTKQNTKLCFKLDLKDRIMGSAQNGYDGYVSLEKALMDAKHEAHDLFLAAEKGAGKFKDDVTITINPKKKEAARKWLAEECMQMMFQEDKELMTSVDPKEHKNNSKHNECLKEF